MLKAAGGGRQQEVKWQMSVNHYLAGTRPDDFAVMRRWCEHLAQLH
jgi:hypothetical protein